MRLIRPLVYLGHVLLEMRVCGPSMRAISTVTLLWRPFRRITRFALWTGPFYATT